MSAPAVADGDGRQERAARSRQAICEACLDLVQEGALQPSADEVAARAGVSRRSIFNHFADLAELYDAVARAGMQRCAPLLGTISLEGSVAQRLAQLVATRSDFLEAAAPFTRALTAQALVGPTSDEALRVSRDALRLQHREVSELFAAELSHLPSSEQAEVLDALSAALSPLQWEYLRRGRGNSLSRTRAIVGRTLRGLLRDAGVEIV